MKEPKNTVNGKLLIIFGLVLFISLTFWLVNRTAFNEITAVIEQLSQPDQKQLELEQLNSNLSKYVRSHRQEALRNKPKPSQEHQDRIEEIDRNIDQLLVTFKNDPVQLEQMVLLDSIFLRQNLVFKNYIRARFYYVNNNMRSEELDSLNKDIRESNLTIDSNVVSTETTTKTYKMLPPIKIPISESNKKNTNKTQENELELTTLKLYVEQQKDVKTDTMTVRPQQDSLIQRINSSITKVDKLEKNNRDLLRIQETQLMLNNDRLIDQFFEVLNKVKTEELLRTKKKTDQSIQIANSTVLKTKQVSIVFICVAFILLILIIWDLSRVNKYRKALEISKANAEFNSLAKQRFLSNMSHEIRTPLQSIIGFSEVIEQTNSNSPHVRALVKSSNHLLAVVNEMLDFSKVISGKLKLQNEAFQIADLLNELDEICKLNCENKRLEWVSTQEPSIDNEITVSSDRFRIRQIIYNLVGNAIKYTNEGSIFFKVSSKLFNEILELKIEVSDTGIGISEDKIKTIFEEYEQVGNNRKGTGLGLSIVKQIVDALNGTIEVSSKLGVGSKFVVKLRLPRIADYSVSHVEEKISPNRFKDVIWLVDDDELILQLCSVILCEIGIEHKLFSSAEALLSEPWNQNVKLVLSDFRLPGMSGILLLEKLRSEHPDLKMVAMSAQVLPEEQAEMMDSGFNDLLLKPFKKSEFIHVIHQFSGNRDLHYFDLTNLKTMIEDPTELQAIIEQFKFDTTKDLENLKTEIITLNVDSTLLIVHRLAGRIGQLGGIKISKQLKEIETIGRKKNELNHELVNKIKTVSTEIEMALARL